MCLPCPASPPQSPSSPRFIPRQNPPSHAPQHPAHSLRNVIALFDSICASIFNIRLWNLDSGMSTIVAIALTTTHFLVRFPSLDASIPYIPGSLPSTLPLDDATSYHPRRFPLPSLTPVSRPSNSHMHPAIMSMSTPLQHTHTPKS